MSDTQLKLDALYTIFEKHLYDFDDNEESEQKFIDKIVNDYLRFLCENKVAVPGKFLMQIVEELRDQVQQMLVKKMYGALSIEDFVRNQPDRKDKQKTARKKYAKMF